MRSCEFCRRSYRRSSESKSLIFILFAVFATTSLCETENHYRPEVGDIIFQSLPRNAVVDAIEGATGSPYSHCGIVMRNRTGLHVLEALGTVHETPLKLWVGRGRGQAFDVFRFKPIYRDCIPEFIEAAQKYRGRPYDIRYRMDDEKIYCSELIYKAYRDVTESKLGKLVKLGDLEWGAHEDTIIAIEGSLPLERLMITPKDLAAAEQLELVFSRGAWER